MTEANGTNAQTMATAARELFLLGQKTVEARAVLAALKKELSDTNNRLVDAQQIEQLVEANQQLVLAILLAQSDAEKPHRSQEEQRLFLEMREANAQLVIAALSAQNLQASAEHTLAQQRNILTLVAHELRNPLTPISMIAGRLVRVPSEELPRMQALIEGQVQHMSRLVDDLLDVSRASTGKLRLKCRIVDVVPIIHEAIEVCRPVMNTRQLHFTVELPTCALSVDGDPVRLAQILGNLLGNAAKYTPSGGHVTLAVTARDNVLEMSIRDDGIGISAQALPFIFEPFVQDVHAIGFNGAGLGIGLTVVRELVEAHGGTVIGSSDGDGKGSTFIVTLPLAV
ncbi:MAG: HAMP domain-containing histidine kinase [Gammaproteobacteria bacterium]|uniref:sensor histidine kinase n=1 Tax=Pseudomonas mandelii TaxID=75612 RepID=UPI0012B3C2BB|nr:HAMP domain-containing sensor histidine kinase [Pseudomonas mandelii]MBU0525945.1 HAMP domain-containing histidine kinase [Gammaproteobacteria bacterium]MBU0818841.1 HAMP domain-containing histidine kinase [Gammaproteobacteria bacterium]MBU0844245.1 HAMP domain-containing histidine kinase [Gammaproteobacteria bacterium]MBU1843600.1 HAMP domain-containing histidine kinase [Gammaproteobacteria bacterium]MSU95875.1 sensor histidine kinase [Pseudomonas mandelii]